MNGSLTCENAFGPRQSRRWLPVLVIVCCASSPAAAQTTLPKSAHLLKKASQTSEAERQPAEHASSSQSAAAAPLSASPSSASPPDFGPYSPNPKSARLLQNTAGPSTAVPSAGGQSPRAIPPTQSFELTERPAAVNSVPAPAGLTLQETDGGVRLEPLPNAAPETAENSLRIQEQNLAQGAEPSMQQDSSGELTLSALESMALAANPSLGRASAAIAAARGAAVQAGLPFNPTVGYEGQQIGSKGLAEQHGVLVSQEFLRREKRTLSREVACREVQMAEYRYAAQRARVLTDVRVAFYRALRAQRQIDMSADLLRISQQALRAAEALAEAKEIARTDVLQAQIEVDAAQSSLDIAQNQHQSAWNQLAAVTGQGQLQVVPLAGDLFAPSEDIEFEAVLAWLRGQSPEVAVAISNIERARLYWQRQRVEPRPNVSLQGLYNFVDNGIGGDPDAALAVSVPVPLHNRNQGAIQQARYEVVVAERSLAQLEFALQQRLAPVYERYSNAKNLVKQYGERILPASAEVLQLTQKTFEVGEIGFTNLLIVQRSYRQQQLLYLEAAEALRISEAEIDGLLLSGSLTEPAQ